ncbi:TPA: hypothetical protein L4T53_004534 [Pseudomonas aeruginosa]|nr:hypothetical protein [Pseudomonas aeruginosa]
MNYTPECLRNLPRQQKPETRSKRRKEARAMAELTILECIQRLKAARRAKPRDWEPGYNSAITTLELFLLEIKEKRWVGTEGEL